MKRLLLALAALPFLAYAEVDYTLQPDIPAETVRISVKVADPGAKPEFRLPAWCPGWYVLTDCQKKISDVRATDPNGADLGVTPKDTHGWVVDNPTEGAVVFSYRVLGDEGGLGSDRVHVDKRTTFVNGPAAFMYLAGRIKDPVTLKLQLAENWDVATAMESTGEKTYAAADYDELIDSPLQLGSFERKSFKVGGIPFEAVYAVRNLPYAPDLDFETDRLKQICTPEIRMFGSASFKHYTFIVHMASGVYESGLEHRACTVLDVANTKPLGIDELAAHEFFHAWNVKQNRPKVLGPFDYTQPCRTHTLWFLEGVTDYYAYLHVYRSGLGDERFLFSNLSMQIATLQRSPSRLTVTLDDACYDTWEHGGFGYGDLSYYTKGLVVGLIFDAAIREATQGAKSLDDVLRSMYSKYKYPNAGYEENGVLAAIDEVSGQDMSALYRQMLQSTDELPYQLLQGMGLRLQAPGGRYPDLGIDLNGKTVQSVTSFQEKQGLQVGDRLVVARRTDDNRSFQADVLRNGEPVTVVLPLASVSGSVFRLERDPFATADAQQRLTEWLKR